MLEESARQANDDVVLGAASIVQRAVLRERLLPQINRRESSQVFPRYFSFRLVWVLARTNTLSVFPPGWITQRKQPRPPGRATTGLALVRDEERDHVLAEGGCVDELAQAIRRVAKGVTEHDDDDITFGDALPHFSNEFITRSHTTIHVEPIRHFSCEENALAERLCYSLGTSIVAPIIGKKDGALEDFCDLDLALTLETVHGSLGLRARALPRVFVDCEKGQHTLVPGEAPWAFGTDCQTLWTHERTLPHGLNRFEAPTLLIRRLANCNMT